MAEFERASGDDWALDRVRLHATDDVAGVVETARSGERDHGVEVVECVPALVAAPGRPRVGELMEPRTGVDPVEVQPPQQRARVEQLEGNRL